MWINTPNNKIKNNNTNTSKYNDDVFNVLIWKEKIDLEKKKEYKDLISTFWISVHYPNSSDNADMTKDLIIEKMDKIKDEKEFIDCMIEISDNSFKLLCDNIQIPKEVFELREKYKVFQGFIMTIKTYKFNKMWNKNNDEIEKKIRDNLDNPLLKYLITYKTDNWLFSLLETDFDLPEEIKINRKSYNHHILRQSEDISQIQDSLCDLIFSNNSTNVKYDIKSILDRCNYVPNYLSDKDKEVLELIYKFLNYNNDENENLNAEINNICKTIKDYDDKMKESWSSLKQFIDNLIIKTRNDFQNELEEWITKLNFSKQPDKELLTNNWEKVPFYEINSSEKQCLLVRSVKFLNPKNEISLTKEAYKSFLDNDRKIGCSYSIISSYFDKENTFSSHSDQVLFWFSSLWGNEVLYANTFDSNSWPTPRIMRYAQQYFPIDNFLEETDSYNEIFISNKNKLIPNYIICHDNNPRQELIELAYEFGIPIVHFNWQKENKKIKSKYSSKQAFDYDSFWSEDRFVICPKCYTVKSPSSLLEML